MKNRVETAKINIFYYFCGNFALEMSKSRNDANITKAACAPSALSLMSAALQKCMSAGAEPGFSWRFLLTQQIIPREGIGVCNEGLRFIFFIAVPFERSEFYLSSHLSCSLLCNQSEPRNLRSSL